MQRICHANGVITYTFETFANLPVHVYVSTRHGGVSPAPWNTLNFSIYRGDTPARVRQNQERLAAALAIDADMIVRTRQTHGTGVAKVDASAAGSWYEDCDALITEAPAVPLMLVFADCVPIVLYDSDHHAVGICHAGWRGTVNGAAAAMLWAMRAAYGTEPAALWAGIGPSIGPASYPVGQEVVDLAYVKLANAAAFFSYPHGRDQQPHFDLWQANAAQLIAEGVPPTRIEVSALDTAQNTADFFSHRAEQGRCGLFSMVAWLA